MSGGEGNALGKVFLDGVYQRDPGKRLCPLANGMGFRDKVGNLEVGPANAGGNITDTLSALLMAGDRELWDTTIRCLLQLLEREG